MFMSISVGGNIEISNGYRNASGKEDGSKGVREFSNYLMNKFSCLTPGKNVAVSVTAGMLRKAMSDEKTGQWLERELDKAPDYIAQAQQSASARGWKLTSVSIEFGEEYTTMCTCVVTDAQGTDPGIDKWLEKVKDNKEKQKAEQKKAEKKAAKDNLEQNAEEQRYTFKGNDLRSVTDSFIEKMSTLNSLVGSVSGFDMMV